MNSKFVHKWNVIKWRYDIVVSTVRLWASLLKPHEHNICRLNFNALHLPNLIFHFHRDQYASSIPFLKIKFTSICSSEALPQAPCSSFICLSYLSIVLVVLQHPQKKRYSYSNWDPNYISQSDYIKSQLDLQLDKLHVDNVWVTAW